MAALASRSVWADIAVTDLSTRSKPVDPITLQSPALHVVLDRKDGLPYEYRLPSINTRLRGEDLGEKIRALICQRDRWEFRNVAISPASVKVANNRAAFHFDVTNEGKSAAGFVLIYNLTGPTVTVTLEDIKEQPGYELIEVQLPRLVTVREQDGPAWIAHGDSGGALVSLNEANARHLQANTFWGNVAASLPVVMVGTDKAMCVQEVTAYMDGTELAVVGEAGNRRAFLGTVKTHRINGSESYDMNTGPGTPRISGNRQTPNLLVGQKSSCRLDFLAISSGHEGWLEGATLVRKRMPAIPTHYYDNKFVYGLHCDEPKWEKPGATFAECEQFIRKVSALTDNSPQVVHLWGWQYRGKDTGYPAVAEIDKRVGTYEDLMRLMEEARKFNCTVTFSDNYDDAYKSSPAWDAKYIARRPDGELWESRNWTGENSFIIGLAKYMQGPGRERVRYTCERYKLRETTHVDVLSYFPIRNDWDPEYPASGIKNLFEGRYKVLEEFAKHGVDVSSEALRYAFIGKISSYWHMPTPAPCPFGGKAIPLLPAIYRQSAVWGEAGRNRGTMDRVMNTLFHNMCPHPSIGSSQPSSEITDIFYLMMVPWFHLHARNIESFRQEGDRTIIGLEGNALIDLDWAKKTYVVTLGGAEVARDGSTFCPMDENRIAFYSVMQKELSAPLPKGWDPNGVTARALTPETPQEVRPVIKDGVVTVSVPAQQPVIVYRSTKRASG